LRIGEVPLLWLPYFRLNLDTIGDTPFKYRVRWGGFQGPRIGIIYELANWELFKAFVRVDLGVKRGPGGGLETDYHTKDRKEFFLTSNYIARDAPVENPKQHTRYRFEGLYGKTFCDDSVTLGISYDKLSDKEMETDYFEMGLELKTAHRTELSVRHQMDNLWISNFLTRVRINSFETMKQELPSLDLSLHPILLGSTGIVMDNQISLSYLDFIYSKKNREDNEKEKARIASREKEDWEKNYASTRAEFSSTLYRPFSTGPLIHTPQAGFVGIHFGTARRERDRIARPKREDDRRKGEHWLALGTLGYQINTQLSRHYGPAKHAIEPYLSYNYYTCPTITPPKHYVFDIQDGWFRLNKVRFGCRNLIYRKEGDCLVSRYLSLDLYADAFIDTPTITLPLPYLYGDLIWDTWPNLRNTLFYAWDTQRRQTGSINLRSEYTLSEDFAIAAEYRHRNPFYWRKVDHTNFILESFHSERELRHSQLSDKRDTLLVHCFYRFLANWAIEFESRFGWNRERHFDEENDRTELLEKKKHRHKLSYDEYDVDLLTTLAKAWNLRISYQHKEDDHRVALYIGLGVHPPKRRDCL
jgi:hypothetical protein